jgi:hypothetical protein
VVVVSQTTKVQPSLKTEACWACSIRFKVKKCTLGCASYFL